MQIIPAERRYLGMFVMVEVYHSVRLCRTASHELMMNARRDRKKRGKERGQTAAERRQGDGRENRKRESEISQKYRERLVFERPNEGKDWRQNEMDREGERGVERRRGREREQPRRRLDTWSYLPLVVLWWNNHGIHLITSVSLKNMGFHKCAAKCFNQNRMAFL